jgi:hypothetical protein
MLVHNYYGLSIANNGCLGHGASRCCKNAVTIEGLQGVVERNLGVGQEDLLGAVYVQPRKRHVKHLLRALHSSAHRTRPDATISRDVHGDTRTLGT